MKNKSQRCSTGHATGVIHEAGLHEILERDGLKLRRKREARWRRKRAKEARHGT